MNDPLLRATSTAPATLGEGCTRRYDPQALGDDCGAEFADAAELWQRLQVVRQAQEMDATAAEKPEQKPR